MSLGQRIRQLRQSRGLTQAQLAGQDLTKSFISLMERDLTQPSVKSLVRVARSLGVSIDSLLGSAEHVPDQAAGSLLTLSADAIRGRNFAAASQLLAAANFLSRTYGLEEPAREVLLQEAQIALEARGDAKPWAKLVEAKEASERVNDPWRTGRALVLMGWAKLRQREFTQAASLLQESLAMLRRAKAGR
ncbi:MAG: helix-turn-helix domain-containing protein, partial [Acidimicrobiia bacterium]